MRRHREPSKAKDIQSLTVPSTVSEDPTNPLAKGLLCLFWRLTTIPYKFLAAIKKKKIKKHFLLPS